MGQAVPGDEVVVIGDVVEVARRRRPLRLVALLAVLGLVGWGLARYVASRKRRAIDPGPVGAPAPAVTTEVPVAESPDGEAAPVPETAPGGDTVADGGG